MCVSFFNLLGRQAARHQRAQARQTSAFSCISIDTAQNLFVPLLVAVVVAVVVMRI